MNYPSDIISRIPSLPFEFSLNVPPRAFSFSPRTRGDVARFPHNSEYSARERSLDLSCASHPTSFHLFRFRDRHFFGRPRVKSRFLCPALKRAAPRRRPRKNHQFIITRRARRHLSGHCAALWSAHDAPRR